MPSPTVSNHITLFDDDVRTQARNRQPTRASLMQQLVDALNAAACRFRPIYSFWGGGSVSGGGSTNYPQAGAALMNQMWATTSPSAPGLKGSIIFSPDTIPDDDLAEEGQGITWDIGVGTGGGATGTEVIGQLSNPTRDYPQQGMRLGIISNAHTIQPPDYDQVATLKLGNVGTFPQQLRSGVIYERANPYPKVYAAQDESEVATDIHVQALPTDEYRPGAPIIGTARTATGFAYDARNLEALRDFFRAVYKGRRLHFGWSGVIGSPAYNSGAWVTEDYVDRTANPTEYRYLFDESVGGAGITPTATGPGINIPLRYSASGMNTTVRLYVSVLARMSAASSTGNFAVYNLDSSGAIQGPTALTNPITVSTTSWAWYPGPGAFNPATHPYFLGQAHSSRQYDHVLLCAKRATGSGSIQIAAVSIFAYHSAA